jgi:hypothetical protein
MLSMRLLGTAALAAVVVLPVSARADDASDAKDLFERARQLRASGDCSGALPLFHKAYEVYPSALGSLRNAAECEESVGRWASARRSWLDLKRALMLTHDAKYTGWDTDAEAAAGRLRPRVAHLKIDVSLANGASSAGSDLDVTVNGEALPRTLVGTVLDRDPGKYVIHARLSNGEPAEQTIDVVTGEDRVVRLVVAPPGQPLPRQPRQGDAGSAWTPAGWVAVSLGAAAFIGMGIAIAMREDALGTLSAQCPSLMGCAPTLRSVVDRGDAASTAVTVLAVTGGIATGAGILMLVLGAVTPRRSSHIMEHVAFAVVGSPLGVGMSGRF